MIMNMNEKGRQTKLLAAIAVLAMVVCAFAVVMPSDVSGEVPSTATVPTGDFAKATDIGSIEDLEKLDAYKDGVLTVPQTGLTLNLTADIGNPSNPIDMKIVLDGNLKITSETGKAIYIQATGEKAYTVTFNKTGTIFAVEGANVTLDADGATSSVINNMYPNNMDGTVMVTGGANLTIKHTSGGSTWLDSNMSGHYSLLYVKDSTVNFDDVHAIQNIDILADTATIYANASKNTTITGYFNLTKTTLTGTNIGMYAAKLVDSDVTADVFGVYSGATAPDAAGAYGSSVYAVNTISMDKDSSVIAKKIINDLSIAGLYAGSSTINFSSAGTVSGELTGVKKGDTQTIGTYKFTGINADGVTLGDNARIDKGSTYAAGTTGATAEVAPAEGQTEITNTDISTAFTNGATKVEIPSGTINGTVDGITGKLVLGNNVTIATTETGKPSVTFILASGGSISNDFNNDTFMVSSSDNSKVTFADFSGDVEVRDGSVVIGDYSGSIESGTITLNSGAVKIFGSITGDLTIKAAGGYLMIDDETGESGATLTVEDGATLTLDGFPSWDLSFDGTGYENEGSNLEILGTITIINGGEIKTGDNNTIITYPSTNLNGVKLSGNVEYKTDNIAYEFKGMLDQDFTISTEQSLTGDLWIPDGVTLTIASGGVLNMAGYGIYVQGTLDVQANGAVKNIGSGPTQFGAGTILLHRDGEILNEGVIGNGSKVTVSAAISTTETAYDNNFKGAGLAVKYTGLGEVTMQNVTGVTFSVKTDGDNRVLTISGDVYAYGISAPYTVSANGVNVEGTLTIGEDVVFTAAGKVAIKSGATLNIEGEVVSNGNVVMKNGSTVDVEGTVDKITAETGNFVTAQKYQGATTVVTFDNVTGVVLTVGQTTYTEKNTAYTNQILYISGNPSLIVNNDDDKDGVLTIKNDNITGKAGISNVAAETKIVIDEGVTFNMGGTTVLGEVSYPKATNTGASNFVGTEYTIKGATASDDDVVYITTFANAYAQIANADKNTIKVWGELTIDFDVTLAAKQTIDIREATVEIDADATVDVQRSGAIINGSVADVQGVLTVYNGGNVKQPSNYAVYKKTTDYVQYSGLVPAINGAQPGDVIDVRNPATIKDDLTIPSGVTVNNKSTLTFNGDLTIAETAVLNNEGTIQMAGEKSTVTVNGTFNNDEGSTFGFYKISGETATPVTENAKGESRAVYSTGTTVIGDLTNINNFVNAAYYNDEDGNVVLTTVAKAVAAVETQDSGTQSVTVMGTVNQSEDIALADGTTLTIDQKAKVTLGTVTLAAGSEIISYGELTATVTGMTGVEGSAVASTIELSKAILTSE